MCCIHKPHILTASLDLFLFFLLLRLWLPASPDHSSVSSSFFWELVFHLNNTMTSSHFAVSNTYLESLNKLWEWRQCCKERFSECLIKRKGITQKAGSGIWVVLGELLVSRVWEIYAYLLCFAFYISSSSILGFWLLRLNHACLLFMAYFVRRHATCSMSRCLH